MTNFIKFGLFVALVFGAASGFAQNIATSNIRWNLQSSMDVNIGAIDQNPGYIITYKSDSVVWYASSGEVKKKFVVTETDGGWANASNNGSFIYEIKYQNSYDGNIRFSRSGSLIEIRVIVPLPGGNLLTEFVATNSTTTL